MVREPPCENKGTVMREKIIAAAIMDGRVVCSLPRPMRHHDIIEAMAKAGRPTPIAGAQGFLTSDGTFENRERALLIAQDAKQIKKKTGNSSQLFSEDIW